MQYEAEELPLNILLNAFSSKTFLPGLIKPTITKSTEECGVNLRSAGYYNNLYVIHGLLTLLLKKRIRVSTYSSSLSKLWQVWRKRKKYLPGQASITGCYSNSSQRVLLAYYLSKHTSTIDTKKALRMYLTFSGEGDE